MDAKELTNAFADLRAKLPSGETEEERQKFLAVMTREAFSLFTDTANEAIGCGLSVSVEIFQVETLGKRQPGLEGSVIIMRPI